MLDSLSQRLSKIVKTMRGQARLTEENTKDMLREVRIALLEADVALPVVREVLTRIKEKAMGEEVIGNLNPGQALVGVVQRELTTIIGGDVPQSERDINLHVQPPAVILLAGLQGAGKTTSAGKLAKYLIEEKRKKVLTVSADVYRPAAIDQLKTVTEQAKATWFASTTDQKPLDIAAAAMDYARRHFFDVLIVDTAGRLAIDEAMMTEVADLNTFLKPAETLFVIDAMLGQDAVNTAKAFNERLPLTGVILTKVDGDSRGGAALSVRHVTGKPIKFVGSAEKLTGFEAFDPEAMASRILGMGDIVGLVKDVQKSINIAEAEKLAHKLSKGDKFDLTDFRAQLAQMNNMESFSSILEKLPAQFQEAASKVNEEDTRRSVRRTLGIIDSMTPFERRKPELIKASRKKRIAAGAGVPVQEVNRLLKQFEQSQEMMKRMKRGGLSKMMRALGQFGRGGFPGMGGLATNRIVAQRILGIDPGLNHTGWGVIDVASGTYTRVESGVIHVPKGELAERLGHIARALQEVIARTQPTQAAAERVFVNINPQSTLMLGQARGAALVAANLAGLSVEEFTPSEIKEAVCGTGRADKPMVQRMMGLLLNIDAPLQADEADALACAICCANALRLRVLEKSGGTTRTYATARRGRTQAGARSAWTTLLKDKGKVA